ncbi:hypothetical protein GCM10007852_35440 [Agaribacter marinus]|uniref:Uncharacterized protein n=1 Tax=Agaribacter marinus TaxID=1431249 RepID=A0AA37T076_9ALTE|nr:hypothetical protein GCM10007852_35440 [Agaribacter marinus]
MFSSLRTDHRVGTSSFVFNWLLPFGPPKLGQCCCVDDVKRPHEETKNTVNRQIIFIEKTVEGIFSLAEVNYEYLVLSQRYQTFPEYNLTLAYTL